MARAPRTKQAAPEPEEVDEADTGLRPVGALHAHMADWMNEEFGDDLDKPLTARQVQVIISKRNVYRKSDEYEDFKLEQDAAREEAAAAKAEARSKRAAAADEGDEDEPEAKPARRRGKAAPAAEEAAPAKTRSRRGAAAKATEADEDETPAKPARTRRSRAAATTETTDATPAPARRRRRGAAAEAPANEPF